MNTLGVADRHREANVTEASPGSLKHARIELREAYLRLNGLRNDLADIAGVQCGKRRAPSKLASADEIYDARDAALEEGDRLRKQVGQLLG